MKRFVALAIALTALVGTGAAVAHLKSVDVTPAASALTATTVVRSETRTVTCQGQTLEITSARYTGIATSATTPDLAGPAELRVHSVYVPAKKLGWADGELRIAAADGRTKARFIAVNTDGKWDGWLTGHAGPGDGSLFGSLTGSFTKEGGLSGGAIGSGSAADAALIVKRVGCREQKTPKPSVHLRVRGTVDALSAASISVKPADGGSSVACTIASEKPGSNIAVNDRVEMECVQVSGAWVLDKVREKR
jgi:hypothetical protein